MPVETLMKGGQRIKEGRNWRKFETKHRRIILDSNGCRAGTWVTWGPVRGKEEGWVTMAMSRVGHGLKLHFSSLWDTKGSRYFRYFNLLSSLEEKGIPLPMFLKSCASGADHTICIHQALIPDLGKFWMVRTSIPPHFLSFLSGLLVPFPFPHTSRVHLFRFHIF